MNTARGVSPPDTERAGGQVCIALCRGRGHYLPTTWSRRSRVDPACSGRGDSLGRREQEPRGQSELEAKPRPPLVTQWLNEKGYSW
ncbi:hypothetical protein LEMLEM_LOCUS14094, partial [Lemmus lemmus]